MLNVDKLFNSETRRMKSKLPKFKILEHSVLGVPEERIWTTGVHAISQSDSRIQDFGLLRSWRKNKLFYGTTHIGVAR